MAPEIFLYRTLQNYGYSENRRQKYTYDSLEANLLLVAIAQFLVNILVTNKILQLTVIFVHKVGNNVIPDTI